MSELTERLRDEADEIVAMWREDELGAAVLLREAADRIKELERKNKELVTAVADEMERTAGEGWRRYWITQKRNLELERELAHSVQDVKSLGGRNVSLERELAEAREALRVADRMVETALLSEEHRGVVAWREGCEAVRDLVARATLPTEEES